MGQLFYFGDGKLSESRIKRITQITRIRLAGGGAEVCSIYNAVSGAKEAGRGAENVANADAVSGAEGAGWGVQVGRGT